MLDTPTQVPAAYNPKGAKGEKVKPALLEKGKDKRDSRGRLIFKDFPNFRPTLRPKDVIQAGSFGGCDSMRLPSSVSHSWLSIRQGSCTP